MLGVAAETNAWIAVAGIVGTLLAGSLSPLIAGRLARRHAREARDRMARDELRSVLDDAVGILRRANESERQLLLAVNPTTKSRLTMDEAMKEFDIALEDGITMTGRLALRTEDELVSHFGDALSAMQDIRNVYIGEDPNPWEWIDRREIRTARGEFERAYREVVRRGHSMVGGLQPVGGRALVSRLPADRKTTS